MASNLQSYKYFTKKAIALQFSGKKNQYHRCGTGHMALPASVTGRHKKRIPDINV